MIKNNLKDVNNRIKAACKKANREPGEITLVCVTKGVDPYRISEVFIYGIKDIGENRVQEAQKKHSEVLPGTRWHLVGHLQTNKAKDAVRIFDMVHSVDSMDLAVKLDKEALKIFKTLEVLIQVNTSGEEQKFGMRPETVMDFLRQASLLRNIKIMGLMTITPLAEDPETVRPYLRALRELSESIKAENIPNIEMKYLSMGMSQDFEVAIQEGANVLRIGTAIFRE
ncbi:MAG: YggS family pyridoxal phosphate-dependent enzyme [Candidatus Omnitrophota bacterium]